MNPDQRRRLFEAGEAVIAEAILDALRENGMLDGMRTGEVVEALGLPDSRGGVAPPHPERFICLYVLTRLAEAGTIEQTPYMSGYKWRVILSP